MYYVVDDDVDDRQFLIEALAEIDMSAQCLTACNGQEAIAFLNLTDSSKPDAIFLDLNMPRMNGKQCLAELKKSPALKNIPVIIYSTSSDEQEMAETLKLGAAYFLTKKIRFGDLCTELLSMNLLSPAMSR